VAVKDYRVSFLSDNLKTLFDRHIPLRRLNINASSCPWFTFTVKNAIKNKNKAYAKWKRSLSNNDFNLYKSARNHANCVIRQSKINYFNKKLDSSLPSKALWKNLKQLNVHKKTHSECQLDPNDLNDFFSNTNSVCTRSNIDLRRTVANGHSFKFSPVCETDIVRCIRKIKTNAIGEDGLPLKFLKIVLPYILGPLTHVINHCLSFSVFPSQWKRAIITPVPKKSSATDLCDYRPIAILPCLSKIIEMIMAEQIQEYLADEKLMSPMQSGFRPGHSCSTAIVKITEDIRIGFDDGKVTLLGTLDFTKAFERVDHILFLSKIKFLYNFDDSAVLLISEYLQGRTQRVKVGDCFSSRTEVNCGVPQGSVLGPLLFSIFINDIFSVCESVSIHAYADDIQIYLSRHIGLIEDLCCRFNEDLHRIYTWAKDNKLDLNARKCFVMPICKSPVDRNNVPPIKIGDSELEFVDKIVNLGYHMNTTFSCVNHVNAVVSKIYYTLRNLRLSQSYVPQETKLRLVKQLILPFVSYCSRLYCKPDSASLHKLQVAINFAARYVFDLQRHDNVSNYCKKILGCSLQNFLNANNLIFLHSLVHTRSPHYLYEKICPFTSNRINMLQVSHYNYLTSSRYFFVHAIREWNALPHHIRDITERNLFKKALLQHFANKRN